MLSKELLHHDIERLIEYAACVHYGQAVLTVKLHDGRATETTIAITQSTKNKEVQKNDN
ncbi:MAG: hypothetical protein Ta2B_08270 [Termitinemataceae bacterium]|nr:MAG: hypothetical protein Ta2B_08270 [Termitinemataceae bacterium]